MSIAVIGNDWANDCTAFDGAVVLLATVAGKSPCRLFMMRVLKVLQLRGTERS